MAAPRPASTSARARRRRELGTSPHKNLWALTVFLLLFAAATVWWFSKNHRPKTHPKPLIHNELGWLEGNWKGEAEGRNFSTTWSWENDSTLVSRGFVFENSSAGPLFPNRFFERGDSLFYTEAKSVFWLKTQLAAARGASSFTRPATGRRCASSARGQPLRLVRRPRGRPARGTVFRGKDGGHPAN